MNSLRVKPVPRAWLIRNMLGWENEPHGYIGPHSIERSAQDDPERAQYVDWVWKLLSGQRDGADALCALAGYCSGALFMYAYGCS